MNAVRLQKYCGLRSWAQIGTMGKVLRRKMWRLAVAVVCAAAMVVGVASIVISSLRSGDELRVANLKTLALIRCEEASFEGDP